MNLVLVFGRVFTSFISQPTLKKLKILLFAPICPARKGRAFYLGHELLDLVKAVFLLHRFNRPGV